MRTAVAAPPPPGEEDIPPSKAASVLRALVNDPVARATMQGQKPLEILAPHIRALIAYYEQGEAVRLYNEGFASPDGFCL
jgi:hypothetical protein